MIHCKECLTVFTNSVGSGTVLCKECQAKGGKDIFDTQPTCGELSCDECNERYAKAVNRIAALEDAVRSVCGAFQNFREIVNINGKDSDALLFGINATDKALELLNGGK